MEEQTTGGYMLPKRANRGERSVVVYRASFVLSYVSLCVLLVLVGRTASHACGVRAYIFIFVCVCGA